MVSHGCGGPFFGEKRRLLKLKLDKMDVYLSGDVEKIAAYEAMEAAAAASEGGALPPVPPVAATASAKAKPSADDERPAMQAPTQSQIRKMITKLVTDTRRQMGWEEGLVEVSLHNKSRPVREVERTFRKMNWDFERNKEVPQSRSGAASGAEPKLLDLRKLERALVSLERYFTSEGDAELIADGKRMAETVTRRAKGAAVAAVAAVPAAGSAESKVEGAVDGGDIGHAAAAASAAAGGGADAEADAAAVADAAAAKKAAKKKKKKKKKVPCNYAVHGSKSGGLPVLVEKRKHGRLVTIIQNISGEAKELLAELKGVSGATLRQRHASACARAARRRVTIPHPPAPRTRRSMRRRSSARAAASSKPNRPPRALTRTSSRSSSRGIINWTSRRSSRSAGASTACRGRTWRARSARRTRPGRSGSCVTSSRRACAAASSTPPSRSTKRVSRR